MKQKILITGVGGYIGTNLAYTLLQNDFEVIGIDNFSSGFREPLELLKKEFTEKKFRYYQANLITDISSIFVKEQSIQAVLHLAGICSVNESIEDPEKYFTNNVLASQNLFATMRKFNINYLVFSSTCAVYGEKEKKVTEIDARKPTNPYGESKKMIEDMLEWYGKLNSLHYVTLRYFNVCGASEDGRFGDSKKPSPHLVQNCVRAALGIEQLSLTCPRVNTSDGTPIRDYVDVVDLSRAHLKATEYLLKNGANVSINLSSGKGASVLEIIKKVEKKTNIKIPFKQGATRKGEYSVMISSCIRAAKLLGWKPKRDLNKSIDTLVTWYNEHPKGWNF